jgi:Molecular chaperone GrpE (heat shock protein)
MRTQADFDNYRRRNAESVRLAKIDGGNEVIISLIPLADAFETASKMISDKAALDGVNLVYKQLKAIFSSYGVSEIEAEGLPFDPRKMSAVSEVEDKEKSGKVAEVLRKGYERDGKIIRVASVKVAK